jgi:hypothetical protein
MEGRLVKSKHIQFVRDGDAFVVWHSLFGYPQILNAEGIDLLNFFSIPKTRGDLKESRTFLNAEESLASLENIYFLVPPDFDERSFLARETSRYEKTIELICTP